MNGKKNIKKPLQLKNSPSTKINGGSAFSIEIVLEENQRTKQLIESFKRKSMGLPSSDLSPSGTQRRKSLIVKDRRNSSVPISSSPNSDYPKDTDPREWYKCISSELPDTSRMQQIFCWAIQHLMQEQLDLSQLTLCKSILRKLTVKEINTSWYLRNGTISDNMKQENPLLSQLNELKEAQKEKDKRSEGLVARIDSNHSILSEKSSLEVNNLLNSDFLSKEDSQIIAYNNQLLVSLEETKLNLQAVATERANEINNLKYDFQIWRNLSESTAEFYSLANSHVKNILVKKKPKQSKENPIDIFRLVHLYFDSFKTTSLIEKMYNERPHHQFHMVNSSV